MSQPDSVTYVYSNFGISSSSDIEVSEDVLKAFIGAYQGHLSMDNGEDHSVSRIEEHVHKSLQEVLSSPPLTTVIRVNTAKTNLITAKEILHNDINKQCTTNDEEFQIFSNNNFPDVLFVQNKKQAGTHKPCAMEVIVGELCGSAVLRGADVYVPGILAAEIGMQRGDTVAVYSDIGKSCRRGLTAKYTGKKYFVGNGIALMSRKEIFVDKICSGVAIKMVDPLFGLPSFSNISESLLFPQNMPSLVACYALEPNAGDLVLDMCAAPGGKTTHVAQLCSNKATVIAIDKTKNKVETLKARCKSLGLTSISCYVYDSTKLYAKDARGGSRVVEEVDEKKESLSPPFQCETFDKVLLDPPCSALGQRPRLSCKLSSKELDSYPIYQRKLISQAVPLLKENGTLVYSTCTVTVEENENQVNWILRNYPQLKLTEQRPFLGSPGLTGHRLPDDECKLVQRFDPFLLRMLDPQKGVRRQRSTSEEVANDTIGFFIAKFKKNAKENI